MIRFIDLKRQIDTSLDDTCFAYYDTIKDKFIELDGEQVFLDREDMIISHNNTPEPKPNLDRLKGLIPKDYFNE